ncbi:MAG: YeeE/YedE thiosulfate transporter family protein [Sulfurisoma sp.]|nr:YeeE/YedE thiosulfate transporter family protein [Sulfurisoma sp.]
MSEGASWRAGFKADYESILVESWAPHIGAILMVLIILALMVNGLFWGVFGGLKLWGDWFNSSIGLGSLLKIKSELDGPLMHRMSLMNITLIVGAFAAALISRQFSIFRAPKLEYLWGAAGGTLMGIGATLSGGCTTGGFYTPALHSSPAGWVMAAGLIIGAVIGLKLLMWTLEHIEWGMQAPSTIEPPLRSIHPWIGVALVALIVGWTISWATGGDEKLAARAILVIGGFLMGFVMHRSRLCFARCFREPFMTAEGDMTKAIIVSLAIGIPVAALLFEKKLIDPYIAIPPTFWIGSLLGGLIFGIGMIFAGGCASGALWRAGEGHLKLWVAVFFFAWSGSTFSGILSHWDVMARDVNLESIEFTKVGIQTYLPDMIGGWGWSLAIGLGILAIWYAWVRYNESTEKFTVV